MYVVQVLALKLLKKSSDTGMINLDPNGGQDMCDVLVCGDLLVAESDEKVSCEVLHFDETGCRVSCEFRREKLRRGGQTFMVLVGEQEKQSI